MLARHREQHSTVKLLENEKLLRNLARFAHLVVHRGWGADGIPRDGRGHHSFNPMDSLCRGMTAKREAHSIGGIQRCFHF